MALIGRMRKWREAQRQKAGGMTQLNTWVPARHAEFLKGVFARLADPGSRGDDRRLAASRWTQRRRVVGASFGGAAFSAEIDLPCLGPHWHVRPAGGRVTGSSSTWVELTPDEADEVQRLCDEAVSKVLSEWLCDHGLYGKVRDHVGVALDAPFARPGHAPGNDESVLRPGTDEAFEANEAKIAREVERDALKAGQHPADEPTVVFYEGLHQLPSRCHAVHGRHRDRILFALGHIRHGGTAPTLVIEQLATEMWKRFYPKDRFERIEWFDAWLDPYSVPERLHVQRVQFPGPQDEGGPVWKPAGNVPKDFVAEVRRAVTSGADMPATAA